MADNVLGTLFGDIANAIRTKTGDKATMKPMDFPTKILGIEGGGRNIIVNSGRITPTADKQIHTIEHGLGVVPDLIIVSIGTAIAEEEMANYYSTIYGGFAFSSAFLEKIPYDIRGSFGSWWSWIGGSFGFVDVGNPEGLDMAESSTNKIYGRIRGANTSTFIVGGTSNHMPKDIAYNWSALTGLL